MAYPSQSTNFKGFQREAYNKNNKKELYHFVVDRTIHGVFHFRDFGSNFDEGEFIQLSLVKKHEKKHNRLKFTPIDIIGTDQTSEELLKRIEGYLELKYKDSNSGTDPDFGFIRRGFADYYVPKHLLKGRREDEDVEATVIFCGDKWRTLSLH